MKIYISSSWKNRIQVRELAEHLREHGHEVYDFTDPKCRKTEEIPPEKFPDLFDPDIHNYKEYLETWRDAVRENYDAIAWCDAVVLLLPCGADSHADWALGVGMGKKSIVLGHPLKGERSPVHTWADDIVETEDEVFTWLSTLHM